MLKQIELAAAVKDRLTDVNPNKDLPVALAIVESVIAKVGFCRKPAFYLPVAGSRAPEMAL